MHEHRGSAKPEHIGLRTGPPGPRPVYVYHRDQTRRPMFLSTEESIALEIFSSTLLIILRLQNLVR